MHITARIWADINRKFELDGMPAETIIDGHRFGDDPDIMGIAVLDWNGP